MGLRPFAVAATVLLFGAGAFVATSRLPWTPPVVRSLPTFPESLLPEAPPDPVRVIRHSWPGTGDSPEAPAKEPLAAPFELTFVASSPIGFDLFDLLASPDVHPATGEAPAVPAGGPAVMEIAAFVEAAGAVKEPVVELVGPRKPGLEEGVPVSLAGRILATEDERPVAGARVIVSSAFYVRTHFYDHHLREVASAVSDADGHWKIERVNIDPAHFGRGGRLYASASADGRTPSLRVPVALVTPGVANQVQDICLRRDAEALRGQVLDMWEGKPVAGAKVYATGAIDPIEYPKDQRAALFLGAPTAVTDIEGRFLLEGLAAGPHFVSVHGGDDCAGSERVNVPVKGEFLMKTRAIRGRIEGTTVDAEGKPLALVLVEGGENTTHSFADGRFVLENFRGDAPTVIFSHPDYREVVHKEVKDGTTGLVVRFENPWPRLVLVVKDSETAAPVKRVSLEFGSAPATPPVPDPGSKYLSADGRYEVRVRDMETVLFVHALGRQGATVDLDGRTDGEVVEVLLAPLSK